MKLKIHLMAGHQELTKLQGRLTKSFKVDRKYHSEIKESGNSKLVLYLDDDVEVNDIWLNDSKLEFEVQNNNYNVFNLNYPGIKAIFDNSILSLKGENYLNLTIK